MIFLFTETNIQLKLEYDSIKFAYENRQSHVLGSLMRIADDDMNGLDILRKFLQKKFLVIISILDRLRAVLIGQFREIDYACEIGLEYLDDNGRICDQLNCICGGQNSYCPHLADLFLID